MDRDSYQDSYILQTQIRSLENELYSLRMKLQSLVFPDVYKSDFPKVSAEAWARWSEQVMKPSPRVRKAMEEDLQDSNNLNP